MIDMMPFDLPPIPGATLATFLTQAILFTIVIPLSFIVYRLVRVPDRHAMDAHNLRQLGLSDVERLPIMRSCQYNARDYLGPIIAASSLTFVLYSLTNPFVISSGVWAGVIEPFIDIFGLQEMYRVEILIGRYLFWGFIGAWLYSVTLIVRRFLTYDLTPAVYLFVFGRFLMAWIIGSIVGLAVSTTSRNAGLLPELNLISSYVLVFFIGFFPERGLQWISATAQRALGQNSKTSKEVPLSHVEGMGIFHQSRLRQEGIENAQNLAMTDVVMLVTSTPFPVSQVVDWLDQAIMLLYVSDDDMLDALRATGIRGAADFIAVTDTREELERVVSATGIDANRLMIMHTALLSAPNVKIAACYKWGYSLDTIHAEVADQLNPFREGGVLQARTMSARLPAASNAEPGAEDAASEPPVN